MTDAEPLAEADSRYSDASATTLPWAEAGEKVAAAELFRTSTVRPDGRPPCHTVAQSQNSAGKGAPMDWTLEVIVVPVTDVDRAKDFYAKQLGFKVDVDQVVTEGIRIVQLTPPGSRCSITLTQGLPGPPGQRPMAPGSLTGLQMCVTDIASARAELVERGVDVSRVQHADVTGWEDGPGEVWNSFMFFTDPDGNGWIVQEAPAPLSER